MYLKFSTYGHSPGTFYGEDGVWPYMPEGSITLSDPQINWLTGVGNDSLYISLTNASKLPRPVVITFDSGLTGIAETSTYEAEVILDNGARCSAHVIAGRLVTAVSARGITAIVVRGAGIPAPWHRDPEGFDRSRSSWASDTVDMSPTGLVRGMLLMRPDGNGADAYIHAASTESAILTYTVDDGTEQTISDKPYPNEWTIALPSVSSRIRYRVQTTAGTSPERELFFSPVLTGHVGADTLAGRIEVPPTASPGDELRVTVRLRTQRAWDSVAVTLDVPAGWTVSAAGDNPTALASDHAAAWSFMMTVPDTTTPVDAIIRGAVRAEDATYSLEDTTVNVMEPIRILSVIATPKFVHPGDSVTLAVHVLNRGPIAARQSTILAINPGWLPTSGTVEFDLPPRGEAEKTITLISRPTIAAGTRSYFSARIGENGARIADSVLVRDPNTIEITNNDSYPTFERNGTWLVSGLVGPDGLSSLYSPENETGMAAIWRPDLPTESRYEVSIWYPANAQTSRRAVFIVHHAEGEEEFTINEQVNPSTWNVLGTYRFVAGTSGYVRIEVRNADGYTRLAGARFRRIP